MGILSKIFTGKKEKRRPYCAALVPAAGSSSRMEGPDKLLLKLNGCPVLAFTLRALDGCPLIDEIVVATRQENILPVADLCKEYGIAKPVKIVEGGDSRVRSVMNAALSVSREADFLAVHDGARPLVEPELIEAVIRRAYQCAAAAPATVVKDTIKVSLDGEVVDHTPERATLFAVQTPQVFDASLLKAALQSALEQGAAITDDCSAVERLGKKVYLVEGSYENIKITTPDDLAIAARILEMRGGLL
jgi:2-C-methyl-D-erythritol 4-phosphate cytidylyltransferase